MQRHGIDPIDVLVVNLYPFEEAVSRPDCTVAHAIEHIDIGGPSMLRAAAKNHDEVLVLVDPADSPRALDALKAGTVTAELRRELATKVFQHTARYDSLIAGYLERQAPHAERFPAVLSLHYERADLLRYGENPHQQGAFYREPGTREPSVSRATTFIEVVVAPDYAADALTELKRKKDLRLLAVGPLTSGVREGLDLKRLVGGLIVQDRDLGLLKDLRTLPVPTKRRPTDEEYAACAFAWTVCKHVKSNAIVYAREGQTVGIGAGQMSRGDSVRLASTKAVLPVKGCVMASDAFFPFRDGLDAAAQAGITAVIQPGGSIRDQEVVTAADEHQMAMILTGMRHFRH